MLCATSFSIGIYKCNIHNSVTKYLKYIIQIYFVFTNYLLLLKFILSYKNVHILLMRERRYVSKLNKV